jgi:hypothetical protein
MTAVSKLSDALAQLGKVKAADKASGAALATAKADVREARVELEAPVPPPPPPTVDTRPWETPIETDMIVGAVGQTTKLKAGQRIEHAELLGTFTVADGGEVFLDNCRRAGKVGLGDGSTGIRVSNGHLFTNRCEFTGCEGRSGFYLTDSGIWTPTDTYIHGNGKGGGKMHQQGYIAGGQILAGKRVKLEDGEDNALQLYSPSEYTSAVGLVQIDDLEVCGCPNNSGLMVSHRVEALAITNLRSHDNGVGIYAYETEDGKAGSAGARRISGHVWANKTNVRNGPKLALDLVEAAI